MNKTTKIYMVIPVLLVSSMNAMAAAEAKVGWWKTSDGKDHILDSGKFDQYIATIKRNEQTIQYIGKKITEGSFNGEDGKLGEKGARGAPGLEGKRGKPGLKGDKGDPGESETMTLEYVYNQFRHNSLGMMAVGDAVSNMPSPTSDGYFISSGFSGLGGENAAAVGIYYVDDIVSYKVTYGRSGHEQKVGVGIGFRL